MPRVLGILICVRSNAYHRLEMRLGTQVEGVAVARLLPWRKRNMLVAMK